ncbi:radial spoke head 10 homolog B-like isoform X1 [Melanerpes formicivorus]|uniref:radial spoke head 10 homolog B-like isoform X1 n=1 Tax=Melanerpes formicivorus TaxID=211600 RepID=UPI0035901D05
MAKDKKKEGKKVEKPVRSPVPAEDIKAESSSTKLTDLQTLVNEVEETQANPVDEEPEEVQEPPDKGVPQYEEPPLSLLIVKRYEGEKVCGLYEGEGFAYFDGGNTYKGMFSEGLMHGQGTYTWADGVTYEGTFVKNVQMLNGRYTWNDGSVYEGSIKNGVRHGFGFFRSGTHPVSYIGYWCKGKRHGKGTIYYDQEHTSWYSGDWVNNVKEGWGMRCYRSGNIYEGQWEKNVRHGKGKMRWLTANQEYMGQWAYGIQHGYGTHIWFVKRVLVSQYPLRNEYMGDFVNGERHGHGKFIYANGAVYDGEWVGNKKHGKGRFVFQNGHVYEGEFRDDHIAEYPSYLDAMKAKELNAICTGSHFAGENIAVINGSENASVLGLIAELDITSLLGLLPREERHEELKQVEFAVLRHITELRRVYTFYSSLGCDQSLDNVFLMTKLQFWRFLKDCHFHHSSLTLAEMDRILSGDKTPAKKMHCPHETLLFRTFLSYLVHLAFHIYHEEHKEKGPYLNKCFSDMMSRNVIPTACHTQSILFSEELRAVFVMGYLDKCWEMYRDFCRTSTRPPFEPTMKMRHFLWMLKDFKLLSKQLTASRVVEILVKDGPSVPDSSNPNLEPELVFLEFVEALLGCALVYVTSDMLKEQVAHDNQQRSFRAKSVSEGTTEYFLSQPLRSREDREHSLEEFLLDEQKEARTEPDEEVSLWMCQVQIFFTTKLFPAYQHEKVLREKIKENRIRDAEFAELRKIKDEELAKLIAEKEAEEAKRQEEAAAKISDSKSTGFQEAEKPVTLPPKEEAPIVAAPVATKVPAGKKKKKK